MRVSARIRVLMAAVALGAAPCMPAAAEDGAAVVVAEGTGRDESEAQVPALLAKLHAGLRKLAVAEVKGKPRLTTDRAGLVVYVDVSVDPKAYAKFADRAAALLDKVAVHQSRGAFAGKPDGTVLVSSWEDHFPEDFGFGLGGRARGVVRTPAHLLGPDVVVARVRALRR